MYDDLQSLLVSSMMSPTAAPAEDQQARGIEMPQDQPTVNLTSVISESRYASNASKTSLALPGRVADEGSAVMSELPSRPQAAQQVKTLAPQKASLDQLLKPAQRRVILA